MAASDHSAATHSPAKSETSPRVNNKGLNNSGSGSGDGEIDGDDMKMMRRSEDVEVMNAFRREDSF